MTKTKGNSLSTPMECGCKMPKNAWPTFGGGPSSALSQHNVHNINKGKKVPMDTPLQNTFRTLPK